MENIPNDNIFHIFCNKLYHISSSIGYIYARVMHGLHTINLLACRISDALFGM